MYLNSLKILQFYTIVNLILVCFYKYTAKYIDLHLSCLITAFVSFSISYIHPREYTIMLKEKKTNSCNVFTYNVNIILDIFQHWVPLLFVYFFIPIDNDMFKILLTFSIIMLYAYTFNAFILYNADMTITFCFFILAIITRFVF